MMTLDPGLFSFFISRGHWRSSGNPFKVKVSPVSIILQSLIYNKMSLKHSLDISAPDL